MKTIQILPLFVFVTLAKPYPAAAVFHGDKATIRNGETLYERICASCHGVNLEGQSDWRSPGPDGVYPAPPHDATGHTWHHADRVLSDYVTLGGAAAQGVASDFGVTIGTPIVAADAAGLVQRLTAASGGTMPDAVYLPVTSGPFEAQAAALAATGVQILGSDQWSTIQPWRVPALRGGWYAAPDPIRFEAFALALQDATGTEAGVVAGLAFDASEMARLLGRRAQQTAAGLTREAGFDGVVGPYRFFSSGLCQRGLAVLNVVEGTTTLIGATSS